MSWNIQSETIRLYFECRENTMSHVYKYQCLVTCITNEMCLIIHLYIHSFPPKLARFLLVTSFKYKDWSNELGNKH